MANLETFKEIHDLTLSRINKLKATSQIETNVKSAVNQAYKVLGRLDKKLTTAYVPIINGLAVLPYDMDTIEQITPSVDSTDRLVGNNIITEKTGTFTLIYSYIRESLGADNDVFDLNPKYLYPLSTYACFVFYTEKKKGEVAAMFLQEYAKELQELEVHHNTNYKIQNVFYDGSLLGE